MSKKFEKHIERVYNREATPADHESVAGFFYHYGLSDGDKDCDFKTFKKFRAIVDNELEAKTSWGRNDLKSILDRCAIEALT